MNRVKNFTLRLFSIFFFVLLLVISSCDKNDPAPSPEIQSNIDVNSWILENMKFWYLWNTSLPASPDKTQEPDDFFQSLLSDEDRFSWIQEDYTELLNSLQGVNKEAGYEYVLYKESATSENVLMQVLYIKPGSPAEAAGLKRGDVITVINDQTITTSNYQTLLRSLGENYSIRYKPLILDGQKLGDEKTISLVPVEYSEDPNYLHKVITVDDRRIGYYVYNFFASGVDDSKTYDAEMDQVFSTFKAQGITDLVLDLRFNSGGSETSATALASLIGKGVSSTNVFAQKNYNADVQKEILADKNLGPGFLTTKFLDKASNIGGQLTNGRVYILTSSRTASASELVINALKPYMDVFLIGDVTYGKNVGSISLYDENNSKNTWGMQPIVVKVSNSLGQSDYSAGFTPNVTDKDNSLYLYPLGDPKEALLAQAIGQITGISTTGRAPAPEELKEAVGHSLDLKRSSFRLIIDQGIQEAFPNK